MGGDTNAKIHYLRRNGNPTAYCYQPARCYYQIHCGGNKYTSKYAIQMENYPQPPVAGEGRQVASLLYGTRAGEVGVGRKDIIIKMEPRPKGQGSCHFRGHPYEDSLKIGSFLHTRESWEHPAGADGIPLYHTYI